MERLDKTLASQNCGSRREVGQRIRKGEVTVNGAVVKKADWKVDPLKDVIRVGGETLRFQKFLYLMMNKPMGVLSAARDSRAKTVVDLLPPELFRRGLFPAGRLDRDTEGLLIITDDGAFAHRMLAPRSHVDKEYYAVLDLPVTEEDIACFEEGVVLRDMVCLPAQLTALGGDMAPLVSVTVREGKFHQVKRMFLSRGKKVLSLKRVRVGRLNLDPALSPGEARELTEEERKSIFA